MSSATVSCPSCGRPNPAGVRFCGECGGRLEAICSACGAPNPSGNKFCHACGGPFAAEPASARFRSPQSYTPRHLAEKILTSRSALEGERKQVTVVFVDVSGFTSISERLDPEDVHRLMARAFELMLAEVHRYEGTVNQFLGDGIMALFGAPIAHEDHAQRAAHASLGIQRALAGYEEELRRRHGISFQARQGLNTGLVVVGSIGTDLRMDYTAVGDTTNVAARMQQAAERGRILVSEATRRLIDGYFDTQPLGELAVKGKSEPVRAWNLVGARAARTRLDVAADRGLTPYAGRQRELRALVDAFDRAGTGHGQMVFVVGEPGIGKSRLLHEFKRRLGDDAAWLEGRCLSFGQSIALHPVIDMLKRNFRIHESDDEGTIGHKAEQAVLGLGEDLRPVLPYLRLLLSIDPRDPAAATMDAQRRRAETFDALRRLLVRASEVRPQVFVLEDVHWMDKATEESLAFMADTIPTNRILLILTYRTGFTHPFGERTFHTRIPLATLTPEDSGDIAQAVLGGEHLPEEVRALIVRKGEGNPLFIEELARTLQEAGAVRRVGDRHVLTRPLDEVVIPNTVQDLIMARIDRLMDAPKQTLQVASVIGREFTRRLLDRIVDVRERTEGLLRELKAIELIYEKSLFPELAYIFKHALTQEVAYSSLLMQRRRELHRLIALAVEELYADRLTEHYEIVAYHFWRAEEWGKALQYLMKAADKASRAFANREAAALLEQAAEAATRLGPAVDMGTRLAIHQARAQTYFVLSEFARSLDEGQRALALARESGDRAAEAGIFASMGWAATWGHRFDVAIEHAEQAIALATVLAADAIAANGHLAVSFVLGVTARLGEARARAERAGALAELAGDAATRSIALTFESMLLTWEGRFSEAEARQGPGVRLAREHQLIVPLLWGLWQQGMALIGKGAYERARAVLEECLSLCEKVGDQFMALRVVNTLGWLWMECGDLERGLDLNRRGADGAHKRGDDETIANPELNIGDIFLARGDLALAGELFDGVHARVKNPATSDWMKWRYSMHLFTSSGDLALAKGDHDRARQFVDQALEIALRTNSQKYVARASRLRGEIALARRQWDDADAALREALTVAGAVGNPTQLWKTHLAIARMHAARGRSEASGAAVSAARTVIASLAEGVADADIRVPLLATEARLVESGTAR